MYSIDRCLAGGTVQSIHKLEFFVDRHLFILYMVSRSIQEGISTYSIIELSVTQIWMLYCCELYNTEAEALDNTLQRSELVYGRGCRTVLVLLEENGSSVCYRGDH